MGLREKCSYKFNLFEILAVFIMFIKCICNRRWNWLNFLDVTFIETCIGIKKYSQWYLFYSDWENTIYLLFHACEIFWFLFLHAQIIHFYLNKKNEVENMLTLFFVWSIRIRLFVKLFRSFSLSIILTIVTAILIESIMNNN